MTLRNERFLSHDEIFGSKDYGHNFEWVMFINKYICDTHTFI